MSASSDVKSAALIDDSLKLDKGLIFVIEKDELCDVRDGLRFMMTR
jgi:hypothetical protein